MTQLPILPDAPADQWPETLLVRYGQTNVVGQFRNAPGLRPRCGGKVVVLTERGMEIGEVLSVACDNCGRAVPGERIARYVRASGPDACIPNAGKVLRMATGADLDEAGHIARGSLEMRHYCQAKANELGLNLRVVSVEHVFGGERAIFYFQSEDRIDFRALVKDLAQQYQTRIEMRQIGARDEARLVADFEICGRECCCRSFLKNLKPVNMRMAKTQKATLDPTKVSGRCGRLRCCLRYESETYEQLEKTLPPLNCRVRVEAGVGKVIDRNILTQIVILIMEGEGTRLAVPAELILERGVKTAPVAPVVDRRQEARERRAAQAGQPRKLIDEVMPPQPVGPEPDSKNLSADRPADQSAQVGDNPGTAVPGLGEAPNGEAATGRADQPPLNDAPGGPGRVDRGPRRGQRNGRGQGPRPEQGQGQGPGEGQGKGQGQGQGRRRRRRRGGRGPGGGPGQPGQSGPGLGPGG